MKTSFLGKGKFKLVLFATLCAVVLGCAIFLCFNIYSTNNSSEDNAESAQTEISAPDRDIKATATSSYYNAPIWVDEGFGTISSGETQECNNNAVIEIPRATINRTLHYSITNALGECTDKVVVSPSVVNVSSSSSFTAVGVYAITVPSSAPIGEYKITFTNKTGSFYMVGITAYLKVKIVDASDATGYLTQPYWVDEGFGTISDEGGYKTRNIITIGASADSRTLHYRVDTAGGMSAKTSAVSYSSEYIKSTITTVTLGTYAIDVSACTPAGTYTITFNAPYMSSFYGFSGPAYLTIIVKDKISLTGATITLETTSYTYDGTEKHPTTSVKVGSTTLTANTDYMVTYSNNKNAGTARVTVTGTGNYTGSVYKEFTISPRDISNTSFGEIGDKNYNNGLEIKPTPTITDTALGATLVAGTDFTFSYANNTNAGQATVTVTGTGNYTGTLTKNFTIVARSISNATIANIANQTYTGSQIKPSISLTLSGYTPTYSVSYSNNTNVGTATVTATGTGNFTGTVSKTFTIVAKSISGATIGSISAYTYDGTEHKPTPAITLSGFTPTVSYTYSGNVNAGTDTATVTIKGTGNFTGTLTKKFTINPRGISNATFGTIGAQTYTGSQIQPTPTITDNTVSPAKTLVNDTDFTFSYSDNINVGSATITITGKGNYTGTKSTTFTISGKSLSGATIGALDSFVYNGSEHKPTATVTLDGVTLSSGTDFTFVYSDNVNAGTATVIVKGKGNYSGEKSANFTINPRNISNATAAAIADQSYTGSAKTPLPTLTDLLRTLTKDTDYTLEYADNINVGTAKITVTGNGNYNGTKEVTFIIIARSISGVTVSAISPYTYDGTAKEPKPTVTDGSNTLTGGVDYTLSYRDNVNVGTATLILTGMGNYTGTKEVGFSIQPPSLDGATVTLSETSFTYDGTAKEPRVTSVEVDGVTLRAGTDYTVSYTNNINAGTAKVVITGAGDYVGTTEVTFTISPADIANASVSGLQITYTYTGAAISPEITVTFGGNTLVKNADYLVSYSDNTDVGTATVTVTGSRNFTGTLTDNFTIIRADIASATVTGVNATYAYTTTAITPEPTVNWNGILLVKDTDYTLSYSDNVELGTATIAVAGLGNFSGTVTKTFEIVQADITPSTVTGINATYTFTGSDIEPTVTVVLKGVTLTLDTDYTVAYADNLNVGTATVTITGCGNYTGTVTKNFDIEEADMDDVTVTGIDATYEYTGAAIAPEPTVTANGVTLVKDTDYTVAYADNTDLGTATVTITGLGNFTAVKTVNFEIVAANISNATVTGVDGEYEYTGSAITPEPTVTLNGVTLVKDADYSLSYVNNTDLGEAVINITGIGNYTGLKSTGFRIVEADADGATVTGIDEEYPWTGAAIKPEPTVTLNGVTLVKDTDFTVVYTDNTEIGTATYEITFIGNYTGSAGGTFEIVKAKPDVEITLDYDGVSPLFVGKALPVISAVATYNGATVAGTVSWDTDSDGSDPTLKENENAYNWTFTPDDTDHYEVVTGFETLTAQKPLYIAIRAEWRNGAQPALFTSTSITVVKQNLKITGIFNDGATDEIIGGSSFVINGADGTVYTSMPTVGGNDFSITVTFGDIPPCTDLVGVVIDNVALSGLTVSPADGGDITTDYIALDKFDTASVKVTANYNDGTEKTLEFGRGGYSVIYAQGTDYLQFEDTKVTLSFTDNGVTKTVDVEGLNIVKKVFDRSSLSFNPADRNYAFGSSVTGDIKVENMPSWLQVTYEYEDAEGNLIDASDVKNAGTYKVTAKFTVNKNYEDIEDMTATFRVTPVEPALTPAVGGSLAEGTALKDLTITVNDGATTGTLTWDDTTYALKAGINRCYYTFTPDDTVNFKVVHGYVDIMADVPTPETVTGETLGGWQIALIVVSVAVAVLALIALIAALKSRRMAVDADGFYDDASPEDMN